MRSSDETTPPACPTDSSRASSQQHHLTHRFASHHLRAPPTVHDLTTPSQVRPITLAPSPHCQILSPPHFMQPESPAASTPDSTEPASPHTAASSTQHGIHDRDLGGVSLSGLSSPGNEDGTRTPAEQLAADAALAALLQEEHDVSFRPHE